jgi:SAM-dependent methyltransferase
VQTQAPATSQGGCCGGGEAVATAGHEGAAGTARDRCCEPGAGATAAERFYGAEELAGLPGTVTDASLGCGNPLAIAELQAGEVVLDLGSGGGIDCFLAARKVGPAGQVIGLDMTPDMIKLARRNARQMGVTNVDFRYGEMEEIPLPDESVDVVISNCVINLSPDKDAVFGEVYRTLRPGGRLSVSDIVTDGELPPSIRTRLDAWAACVAGALSETAYLAKMRAAGFEQVEVLSRDTVFVDELYPEEEWLASEDGAEGGGQRPGGAHPAQTIASVKVSARKPAR